MHSFNREKVSAQRGSFAIEALIFASILLVVGLIWWPFSKAEKLATSERSAAGVLRSFSFKLDSSKDMRELVAASSLLEASSFVFHTENLAEREGYFFRFTPLPEGPAVYAWPAVYGQTGNAAFLLDPPRPILETRNHRKHYSGLKRTPQDKAGLPAGKDNASQAFGKDAQEWRPILEEPGR